MRYVSNLKLAGFATLMTSALLVLVAGCGNDATTEPPPTYEFAPPTGLTAVNGDNEVFLTWTKSPYFGASDFKGYNVYRHTATMIGANDALLLTYKQNGAAVVTETRYRDTTARNSTKYYYAVRAVRGSGQVSAPTDEYDTAPRHEGDQDIELGEYRSSLLSGLNCATPRAYTVDDDPPNDNRLLIDCYLGTMGNNDEIAQNLALKSPHLVRNHDTNWSARTAELVLLDPGQTGWDTPNAPTAGWAPQVDLGTDPVGKVIAVRTPGGAGVQHYAKVMITSVVNGTRGQRVISATVAYQGIVDYPRFVARR